MIGGGRLNGGGGGGRWRIGRDYWGGYWFVIVRDYGGDRDDYIYMLFSYIEFIYF